MNNFFCAHRSDTITFNWDNRAILLDPINEFKMKTDRMAQFEREKNLSFLCWTLVQSHFLFQRFSFAFHLFYFGWHFGGCLVTANYMEKNSTKLIENTMISMWLFFFYSLEFRLFFLCLFQSFCLFCFCSNSQK